MKFSELVSISELRELCESFTSITGAVTAILDLEGNILTATGWQDICTRFHRGQPATACRCQESDTVLAGLMEKGERYNVYKCKNGLIDVAVPITIGGEHVANFFTGQFFLEPPDKEYFIRQAEEFGFDQDSYIEALNNVPIFSVDKVRSMMEFFTRLAQLIGEMGLARKNLMEANAELRKHQEHLEELVMERTTELSRANAELQAEIAERKRAEEALRFSEARFRALYHDNPTMIVTLDADLTMLSVNPFCASQLGYAIDELVGQSVLNIFHEDDRPAVSEQLQRCLQNPDQVYRWQLRKVHKEGGLLWVEEIAQAVYDLNGELNILIVCQDITERKWAEDELRKSELKLSKIFHSVPALIGITTREEGRCIDINDTGLRTLGYRREEIVGRTMLELGVWETKSARDRAIRILEEEGMVRDLEINLRSKNGKIFTVLYSAEPIDFNGERYILSIVKDITERKRMEDEIERLNTDLAAWAAELEAANKELEAFNYTVAHDLRKPLAVINGYCQVIGEMCGNSLDEQCRGYLREAYDGTLRMNGLIDALLNFSRLAHVEPRPETVDLSAMAHEVAAELKLAEPGRRVTFLIAEGISADGDANLLRAVLDNLLGNAWKFTSQQEEAVIEFGVATMGEETVYLVRDNGPGFDMADAKKLFVPFHRIAGKEEFAGHGIGLATVERIIRRHGGRVWAEGAPGQGAIFYFTLGRA